MALVSQFLHNRPESSKLKPYVSKCQNTFPIILRHNSHSLAVAILYFLFVPPPFFQSPALFALLVLGFPFFFPPAPPPTFKSLGFPALLLALKPSNTMLSGVLATTPSSPLPSPLFPIFISLAPVLFLNLAAPARPSSLEARPERDD